MPLRISINRRNTAYFMLEKAAAITSVNLVYCTALKTTESPSEIKGGNQMAIELERLQ